MSTREWPISYAAGGEPDWPRAEGSPISEGKPKEVFEKMASDLLWQWTGRKFGIEKVSIRPRRARGAGRESTYSGKGPYTSLPGSPRPGWEPVLIGGSWLSLRCGSCSGGCNCEWGKALVLPGPVKEVTEVLIDGEVLDPSAYYLTPWGTLVRMDGGFWPNDQDLLKPPSEKGTWQITYRRGVEVPEGGQIAAGVLARELFLAACSDDECSLPQRVQSITRQGVTVAVLDSFDDVEKGRTGIWLIDSWVASVSKSPRPSSVMSPDVRRNQA